MAQPTRRKIDSLEVYIVLLHEAVEVLATDFNGKNLRKKLVIALRNVAINHGYCPDSAQEWYQKTEEEKQRMDKMRKIEQEKAAAKKECTFRANGRLNMDRTSYFDAGKFLQYVIAEMLDIPVEECERDGSRTHGEPLYFGPGGRTTAVARMNVTNAVVYDRNGNIIETGYADIMTRAERIQEMFNTWASDTRMPKTRIGMRRNQQYVYDNYYDVCDRSVPDPGSTVEQANFRFFESWLGAVGQLKENPYGGHAMMSDQLIRKLMACQNAFDISQFINENWQELFTPEEQSRIYARKHERSGV